MAEGTQETEESSRKAAILARVMGGLSWVRFVGGVLTVSGKHLTGFVRDLIELMKEGTDEQS